MKNKPYNMYRAGSAKYYRDQLSNISAVAICFDGYDPKNAKQMKELVEELASMATDALNHKKLYVRISNEK